MPKTAKTIDIAPNTNAWKRMHGYRIACERVENSKDELQEYRKPLDCPANSIFYTVIDKQATYFGQ